MSPRRQIDALFCGSSRYAVRTTDHCLWLGGPPQFGEELVFSTELSLLHTAARSLVFGDAGWVVIHQDGRLVFTGSPHASLKQILRSNEQVREAGFELPGRYVDCALGEQHVVTLDDCGGVWAWGNNEYGQLGQGEKSPGPRLSMRESLALAMSAEVDVDRARLAAEARVFVMDRVVSVHAAEHASFALTRDGVLYGWGSAWHGQLLGEPGPFRRRDAFLEIGTDEPSPAPVVCVERLKPEVLAYDVAQVAGSRRHVLIVKRDGSLWGWGANQFGQARGDGIRTAASGLHLVAENVMSCAVSSMHSAYVDRGGRLFTWGCNDVGQLGHGTTLDEPCPHPVGEGYVKVACGGQLTLALHGSGALHHMGVIDHEGTVDPVFSQVALRPRTIWEA